MMRSTLQYGITAWGRLGIVESNKLITFRKCIVKIINNKPKTLPSENLIKYFNVNNVQQLFQRNALYYNYKLNRIDHKPWTYNTRKENNV